MHRMSPAQSTPVTVSTTASPTAHDALMSRTAQESPVLQGALSRRRLLRLSSVGLLGGAAAATLAACGVGSSSTSAPSPAAPSEAPSAAPSTAAAQTWEVPDPRSLTGLSEVEELGDIVPVASSPTPTLPVTLTDADGNSVTVTDISRILALDLYGMLSRTVEGLGLGGNIVGRTQSSTEPVLADLPVVTHSGHELNVESVLGLNPTVVLIDHSIGPREAIDQIRAAGVPTVVLEPTRTLDSLEDDIALVGHALGVDDVAAQLAQRSRAEVTEALDTISQWVPAQPLTAAFLYVRGTAGVFFVLGKGYGADVLIEALGCEDVATAAGLGEITPATAEALATLNPDVILTMTMGLESTGGMEGLMNRPGVAQTTAGTNQRVVAIPDGQALAFGPQSGAELLAAARALYQPVAV